VVKTSKGIFFVDAQAGKRAPAADVLERGIMTTISRDQMRIRTRDPISTLMNPITEEFIQSPEFEDWSKTEVEKMESFIDRRGNDFVQKYEILEPPDGRR
jgi:hypothetical protein